MSDAEPGSPRPAPAGPDPGGRPGGSPAAAPGGAPAAKPARTPAGARRRAVLAVLSLALLALVSGVPEWVRSAGTTALEGEVPVAASGTEAAPGVPAAALVLLSAGIAVALAGRIGRWVVVAAVLLAGVLLTASAVSVLADPEPVVRRVAAAATGVDTLAAPAALTVWPWVAAGVGAVVLLAGAWLALTSARWLRSADRHVRAGAATPDRRAAEPDDDQAAWDALSRGHDPT